MKKFMKHRVLPMICAFSCLVSFLVVPVAAAEFPTEFRDYDAVDDWNARLLVSNTMGMNALAQALKVPATANEIFWALVNGQVSNRAGEVNRSELEILAASYTAFFTSTIGETFGEQIKNSFGDVFNDMLARTLIGEWDPYFEVHQHPSSGLYRIKEMSTGLFVVDSAGRYPYAEESSDGYLGSDQWVPISAMDGGSFRMLSKEAIYNLADDVGGTAYTRGNYICIAKNASSGVVDKMVLANEDGKPYVCWKDKSQSATEQERPTTNVTENGNIVEGDDNSINLDLEGMTMLLPGGTLAFIDQIIYDESTKSYHIDSHDTYNTTINNYYTWNYYINYTSITYIGQTEEYNKYYEVYYELPDGRSSADLTKEDLEQLNLSVDVIPYGRSADDTSLRSLYHFDGDTKDSSYWNYCTDFTWNKGASLTYMDAGVFEGALYLDEQEHQFTFTLPSNIGSSDFTLQFRYYQSATAAPVTDSSVKIGDGVIFQMDGSNFKTASGTAIAPISIGNWQEVALIRSNGTLRLYHNGLPIFSYPVHANYTGSLGNEISFVFGSQQQTFKYFDEFRLIHKAIAEDGANYEPTSVPHDTNLTLVLPDSKLPVADEYWSIKNEGQTNILSQYNMDYFAGTSNATNSYFRTASGTLSAKSSSSYYGYSGAYVTGGSGAVDPKFPAFARYGSFSSISFTDEGFRLDSSSLPSSLSMDKMVYESAGKSLSILGTGSTVAVVPSTGIFSALNTFNSQSAFSNILPTGYYTFTLVTSSGSVKSVTFNMPSSQDTQYGASAGKLGTAYTNSKVVSSASVDGYTFGLLKTYGSTGGDPLKPFYWLFVRPSSRTTPSESIVYMELVEGKETALEAEWIESVTLLDKSDLNTPTLAVRTDIDITSYQIGGVRPSIPEKGQVWAMVESDRIVSIQIYNGQAWEGVDGRIWTGERWIPASSYNIITLQDMYDIVDATPNYEYIYSEAGFWAWWQKSWNAFTEKLFATLGAGGATGGTSINPDKLPSVPDDESTVEDDGWSFVELLVVLKDGTWNVITGVVSTAYDGFYGFVQAVSDSGSFFDYYDPDNEQSIFFIPLEEGASVWD